MSESYYGAFCRGCGEMVAEAGFTYYEMVTIFQLWERPKIKIGREVRRLLSREIGTSAPCKCIRQPTHTFTTAELNRLIETACTEQRCACAGAITNKRFVTQAQNAPCPNAAEVVKKFEERKNDDHR